VAAAGARRRCAGHTLACRAAARWTGRGACRHPGRRSASRERARRTDGERCAPVGCRLRAASGAGVLP